MQKKQVFNLEDSNIANLGSDLDKQCRIAAAEGEPQWQGVGQEPGLKIWRIEKFKVVPSKTPAGHFFSDDSYICLKTVKDEESGKLKHDIHFWLGETTSQDEAGTAAYKTVELDDLLGGGPVQHREVQGHESKKFVKYFPDGIRILAGGIESGFNHVKPEEYRKRLLWVKGRKIPRVVEVDPKVSSMNKGDVFILDCGLKILQWNGSGAGMMEKNRASTLCRAIDDERKGQPEVNVYNEGDKDEGEFWEALGDAPGDDGVPADVGGDDVHEQAGNKKLFRLSDEEGKLDFVLVAGGDVSEKVKRDALDESDVFIFDVGNEVFTWIGKEASAGEKSKALHFAQDYLQSAPDRPNWLPITRVLSGGENEVFESSFD